MHALPFFDDTLRHRFISQRILVLVGIERALVQRLTSLRLRRRHPCDSGRVASIARKVTDEPLTAERVRVRRRA
jgi:hypothetical protein